MRTLRLLLPIATATAVFFTTSVFANVEMGKKEKKACTVCHDKGKATKEAPLLNATGKYYKEKKTLEGAPK